MKQLQQLLSRFICIFCASFVLVGCSYFDTGEEAMLQTEKPVVAEDAPVVQPQPVNVSEAVARSTDGRVLLFDLDGGAPMESYQPAPKPQSGVMEVAPAPAVPVGQAPFGGQPSGPRVPMVYSGDPSVQIFPFDDGMFAPAAAAPAPVTQPAKTEEYVTLADGDGGKTVVYFAHDSTGLSQDALAKIAGVANSFNNAAGMGLTVEGHSSVRANYESEEQRRIVNLKVSMDRAFAVASELINQGIPAEAIRVMAWGDAHPPRAVEGKTTEEAARRVEISG